MVFNGCSISGHCMHHFTHITLNQVKMLSVSMCYNIHWMHVWFLASDLCTECCCHAFLVTCHFQKFVDFSAIKMATHEELMTPIYTLFWRFNSLTTIELGANKNSPCLKRDRGRERGSFSPLKRTKPLYLKLPISYARQHNSDTGKSIFLWWRSVNLHDTKLICNLL